MLQIGPIFIVAASLLTAGSVWAAVHEEKETEAVVATETPGGDQTPVPTEGVAVQLIDPAFSVTVDPASTPAGSVTFNVTNTGTIIHNLRVIKSDEAPDALPMTSDGFYVDEEQVEIAGGLMKLLGSLILWSFMVVVFFQWYAREEAEAQTPRWEEVERELHELGLAKK